MRLVLAVLFVVAATGLAGAQGNPNKSDEVLRQEDKSHPQQDGYCGGSKCWEECSGHHLMVAILASGRRMGRETVRSAAMRSSLCVSPLLCDPLCLRNLIQQVESG